MRLFSLIMCLIMTLMTGCPASVVSNDSEGMMDDDCRLSAYQCASGFSCQADSFGEFFCVPADANNPMPSIETSCQFDNGGCGDPETYLCIEREGSFPACQAINDAQAPTVHGAFVDTHYTKQGENDIESCHTIYLPSSNGSADISNGCESCTYVWNLTYNLVYNSCLDQGVVPSFVKSIGVDTQQEKVFLREDTGWEPVGGFNNEVFVNHKSAVFTMFDRESDFEFSDVHTRARFIELTWSNESVSCGDFYCDYGDLSCPNDCLSVQTPATGYRFRSFGFYPESQDYRPCYSVAALYARKDEAIWSCDDCSNTWYFQTKTILNTCGPWSNPVGNTDRSDLGVRNENQLVHANPIREGWFDLTEQYSQYHQEYKSLLASFDALDYEDSNLNAQQEANEPDRTRTQVTVIHYE